MKKMRKSAALLCAAAVGLSTVMAGCGNSDSGKASNGGNSESNATSTDTSSNTAPHAIGDGSVELTIFCGLPDPARAYMNDLSENPVVQYIMKDTGLKLNFVHAPAGDDGSYFQQMLASGELPDIMFTSMFNDSYPGGVETAMEDGVLYDVTDLVESDAPNFKALLEEEEDPDIERKIKGDTGKVVKFGTVFLPPTCNKKIFNGLVVRKDWLDKYNLEAPVTIDEYTEVLRTFKKNGVEVPLALCDFNQDQFAMSSPIASAFNVSVNNFNLDGDGNVKYGRTQDGYKEFLSVLKGWAEEGLIDTDFVSRTKDDAVKLLQNGTAAMTFAHTYDVKVSLPTGKAIDPDFEILALEMPKVNADDETHMSKITSSINNSSIQVSADCKHPKEAVQFIDYLMSPEIMQMTAWGTNEGENKTFTEDADGNREFTDFVTDNPDGMDYNTVRSLYMCAPFQLKYDESMESAQYSEPECHQSWDAWGKQNDNSYQLPIYLTYTAEESKELTQIKTKLANYSDEMVYRFIFGEVDLDTEWDKFVSECKNLGSERGEEIVQAAYDRYVNRK